MFQQSRRLLKTMGELAGVPVEPDQQTTLVDGTLELSGVVAAGVPGAGGFDAIFAIIINDALHCNRQGVEAYWSENSVLALVLDEDEHGILLSEKAPQINSADDAEESCPGS